jgi:hypothetical protein
MRVVPRKNYHLVGTGIRLDCRKVYNAVPATNQPYYKERGLVHITFGDSDASMLLKEGEYDVVKETRCGECDNCRKLDSIKDSVLRCVNPPFSSADDDVISVWNSAVENLPCMNQNTGTS